MKRFLNKITDILADAALLEMGVDVQTIAQVGTFRESLEENLVEVAFAEEADYDDIHEAIQREHRQEKVARRRTADHHLPHKKAA